MADAQLRSPALPPNPRRLSPIPAIVAVGIEVFDLMPGQREVNSPAIDGDSDDVLLQVYESLLTNSEPDQPIVAIAASESGHRAERSLAVARSLVGDRAISLHVTSLPPLAASVLVSLASAMSSRLRVAGVLAGALSTLEEQLLVVACLTSVARLNAPAPSLAQHAHSFLPSSRFAVCSHPEPRVVTMRGRSLPFELPDPPGPTRLFVSSSLRSGSGIAEDRITRQVSEGVATDDVVHVDRIASSPSWWGSPALELVACPTDLGSLGGRILSWLGDERCTWCNAVGGGRTCAMCGALRPSTFEGEV